MPSVLSNRCGCLLVCEGVSPVVVDPLRNRVYFPPTVGGSFPEQAFRTELTSFDLLRTTKILF